LAARQADLLGGVHLPALVGPRGPPGVGGRPAPLGGRPQARAVQAALQGALGRHGGAGVAAAQMNADIAGAPSGVLAAQLDGLLAEPLGVVVLGAAAALVGGGEGVAAAAAAEELLDGAEP
jgi:hypothetical protein